MSEGQRRYERYLFLEGVFIGVYGNWLISALEKLTLASPFPLNEIQFILGFSSIWSLGVFFVLSFFEGETFKPWKLYVLAGAHFILMEFALAIEWIVASQPQIMASALFGSSGAFYWLMILMLERLRITRMEKQS